MDGKLQLNLQPTEAVTRYLIEPQADIAAMRNLRRDTIDHEYAWICSWMCKDPTTAGASGPCGAVQAQMRQYRQEQSVSPGWQQNTSVIEGALLLINLRSAASQCLLCAWFNEYVRFGERDQLSFSYVLHTQQPKARIRFLPRRFHWSVTVEDDTQTCYQATDQDAATFAVRFQHGTSVNHMRGKLPLNARKSPHVQVAA